MGGLPLSWSELTPEDRARVQDNFYEKSVLRDLVRYENGVVMPRLFAEGRVPSENLSYLR